MAVTELQDGLAGLTAFQRDLLVVLADHEPCKGVTVMNAIKDRHPSVTAGRIYPNLDDLIVMDFATKRKKDGRTNEYRVTDRGETALADHRQWIADNLDDPEVMTDGGVDVGSSEQTNQPLVWIKVEDLEPGDGDAIAQGIQDIVPDHEVIVTTDELELIDAHEMKDVLERMLDDD